MAETCYRHPDRETRVSCSSCGRPICPDCMTPTPVGMRCPECASQRTKVVRNPTGTPGFESTPATYVLIAINVIVFLIEIAGAAGGFFTIGITQFVADFALFGPSVAEGEWYRLLTNGFLHAGIIHIGFNMFLLLVLGRLLEPALGTPRFLVLYFASLLAGSFGALVVEPNALTVGASGAVFGLAGTLFWPNRLVSHARSQMRERELPCLTGRHILEATPDALVAKCDVTDSKTRWAGVHHVAETTRHVFVMLSSVQGYVVPKARIREGNLEQFAREAQMYSSASAQRPTSSSCGRSVAS